MLTIDGVTYTSLRGARRLIARKLAERQSDGTLRMLTADHRSTSDTRAEHCVGSNGPRLSVIVLPFRECWLNTEAAVLRFPGEAA